MIDDMFDPISFVGPRCLASPGIVVGYDAVHVIDSYGRFFADAPHIHFRCKANFLVFAPEVSGA